MVDITVTYKTFWWKKSGIFTIVFYKGKTRWCRLTLTGQVAIYNIFVQYDLFSSSETFQDFGMLSDKL